MVASVVSSLRTLAIFQINHRRKAWLENPIAFKSRTGWCSKLSFPRAWSNCYRRCVIVHCYEKVVRWTVAITTKRRRKTVIEWPCSASIRTSFRIFSNIYPASGALATRERFSRSCALNCKNNYLKAERENWLLSSFVSLFLSLYIYIAIVHGVNVAHVHRKLESRIIVRWKKLLEVSQRLIDPLQIDSARRDQTFHGKVSCGEVIRFLVDFPVIGTWIIIE